MQPLDPQKPLPAHYNPSQFSSGSRPKSFCGCFAIGCGAVLILVIVGCGSLWYVIMNTAIPLRFIADEIQKGGNFQVEGLKGSFTSGIEADAVRFRPDKRETTEWSELSNLKVRYRFNWIGIWGNSDFVIEEISVDGGKLYGRLDSNLHDEPLDLFGILGPLQDTMDEIARSGDPQAPGGLQVKRIRFANVTFIDPQTETEFHIDEIRVDGLAVKGDQLTELGDITVRVDGLDITTERSTRDGARIGDKRFAGKVQQGFARRAKQDFAFTIDVSTRGKQLDYFADWFGSRVIIDAWQTSGTFHMHVDNFSPDEFFLFDRQGAIPRNIRLNLTASSRRPNTIASIDADGSFQLGTTPFTDFQPLADDPPRAGTWFSAKGTVTGQTVTARVRVISKLPLLMIELEPVTGWSTEELWAQVVFNKAFEQLNESDRLLIQRSIPVNLPNSAESPPPEREMPQDDL